MTGARVLVVEDNPYNLELVEFLLSDAGFLVRSAGEASEVREFLQQEIPDLILMDMQLPGTDGLSLVEELRAQDRFRSIPIVAVTAHAIRGDRERFLTHGCDGYLAKPIDVTSFVDDVRAFVGRGRADTRPGRDRSSR